jgi:signal recognition particle subunit SRP19
MRGKGKLRLYPAYFDVNLTRSQGRRVVKTQATRDPTPDAIERAAQRLKLNPIVEPGLTYSRQPGAKTGVVLVDKKTKKTETIDKIAAELRR